MSITAILALISQLLPVIQADVPEAVDALKQLTGLVENLFHNKNHVPTADEIAAVQQARKLVVAAVNQG